MVAVPNTFYRDSPTRTAYKKPNATGLNHEWTVEEMFEDIRTLEILMEVANKNCCTEIVCFSRSAQQYARRSLNFNVDRLFDEYMKIIDDHIAPLSKFEINISERCRQQLLEYTVKSKYTLLSASARLQLLTAARKEVRIH